ncbi:MAG: dihydrodipicolinate reductase C-terminal domain-containing protein [Myxococcota bacterium]
MVPVVISGLPGAVGRALVDEVTRADDLELVPIALTSPRHAGSTYETDDGAITLVETAQVGEQPLPRGTIIVDFTTPSAVLPNVEHYCSARHPFVLGTSADTISQAAARVKASAVSAVIAANMAIPVILLQAALAHIAERFAGAMTGGTLSIVESHQVAKRDISGTARAMLGDFEALGLPVSPQTIEAVRDEARARAWGVPEAHLEGHAYHDFVMDDPSGAASLTFATRVHGRAVYAAGAITAVRYLHEQLQAGVRGEVFSMVDVLTRAGRR